MNCAANLCDCVLYISVLYFIEVAREPAAGSNEICLKSRQPVQKGFFNRTGSGSNEICLKSRRKDFFNMTGSRLTFDPALNHHMHSDRQL